MGRSRWVRGHERRVRVAGAAFAAPRAARLAACAAGAPGVRFATPGGGRTWCVLGADLVRDYFVRHRRPSPFASP